VQVAVHLTLVSGDPLFRAPSSVTADVDATFVEPLVLGTAGLHAGPAEGAGALAEVSPGHHLEEELFWVRVLRCVMDESDMLCEQSPEIDDTPRDIRASRVAVDVVVERVLLASQAALQQQQQLQQLQQQLDGTGSGPAPLELVVRADGAVGLRRP
jgi:hypothetical protein